MAKNLAANAGDTGLIPNLGRSHMLRSNQPHVLQLWASALEPRNCNCWAHCRTCWSPWELSLCSATGAATAMSSPHTASREQLPLSTAREKPSQQWRPSTAKSKKKSHWLKKIRCQRGRFPWGLPPWLADGHILPASSQDLSSVCVYALISSFQPDYSFRHFSKYSHFLSY